MISWKNHQCDDAEEKQLLSISMLKEVGDPKSIAQSLNNLGIVYFQRNDYLNAEKYFVRSNKSFKKINDINELKKIINNIGYLNLRMNKYSKSLKYYKELVLLSKNDSLMLGIGYCGIASALIELKQIEFAQKNINFAISILSDASSPGDLAIAFRILGDLRATQNDAYGAIKLYEKAIPKLKEYGEEDDLELAIKSLSKLKEK